jgi:hypothetical protein
MVSWGINLLVIPLNVKVRTKYWVFIFNAGLKILEDSNKTT